MLWTLLKIILFIITPIILTFWNQGIEAKEKPFFFIVLSSWILAVVLITYLEYRGRKSYRRDELNKKDQELKMTKYDLNISNRIIQHIEEIAKIHYMQIFNILQMDPQKFIESYLPKLNFDFLLSQILNQIFSFYDRNIGKKDGQIFRVSFMVPYNELYMEIKYHQTPTGIEPISMKRAHKFYKNDGTCAGYVWLVKTAYIIDDIKKYLEEMEIQDKHFKYLYPEQEESLKAIFCIPIYEEPKEDGPFYGVLCIDTNEPGWFSLTGGDNFRKYHLEIVKPFIKRIIYTKKIEKLFKQFEKK